MDLRFLSNETSKIIEFIEENKDKEFWILHCRSGKSRSVATGMFIQKYLKEKYGIDVKLNAQASGTKKNIINICLKNSVKLQD